MLPPSAKFLRITRVLVLCGFCCAVTGCTLWAQKPTAWSNATGAEQFERLWWQEVKEKHWTALEQRLAASYVSQTSRGALDRAAELERLKGLDITDYSIGEPDVRPDGDVLIITYTMDLQGTADGKPLRVTQTRMMTVWQQQKRGWVAIAHADGAF